MEKIEIDLLYLVWRQPHPAQAQLWQSDHDCDYHWQMKTIIVIIYIYREDVDYQVGFWGWQQSSLMWQIWCSVWRRACNALVWNEESEINLNSLLVFCLWVFEEMILVVDLFREMMMVLSGAKHCGGKWPKDRVGWKRRNSFQFESTWWKIA